MHGGHSFYAHNGTSLESILSISSTNAAFYKPLSVTGTLNATTLKENGTNINALYQAKEVAINPYITSTNLSSTLETTLTPYLQTNNLAPLLLPYVKQVNLPTILASYITSASLATTLESYQPKTTVYTATIKRVTRTHLWYNTTSLTYVPSYPTGFWFYDNNGFYLEPYVASQYITWNDIPVQSVQAEIPHISFQGLHIRFPNPDDKKYTVQLDGVYRSDNQTVNQGLFFQIHKKSNGLMLNGIRHSSFYMRWSYNQVNTFLDVQTTDAVTGITTIVGLQPHPGGFPGYIDLCVTLL